MTKIRRAEADAMEAVRRRRSEATRPIDPEVEAALRGYRFELEKKSREMQLPEPRAEPPACPLHPNWQPLRKPGWPRAPQSQCPECLRELDARRNPPRTVVMVDPHPTTAAGDGAWEKFKAKHGADADPQPERGTRQWHAWWEREQRRRRNPLLVNPESTAREIEAQALARIDELREKEERKKNRRPGGATCVYAPVFNGGHDEPRRLYRRRVIKDTGIAVIE